MAYYNRSINVYLAAILLARTCSQSKIKTENMRRKNCDATIIARINTQYDMLYGENETIVHVNGMNTAMWLILK